MAYLNPNKYLRGGIVTALKTVTGLDVWHNRVPISVKPIPKKYIILDSQTKNEYARGKTCFEWMCTIDVNIYNINTLGNSSAVQVDDIEQQVINTIKGNNFTVANFHVKNVDILESIEMDFDTTTESVDRRMIKFDIWLNNVDV